MSTQILQALEGIESKFGNFTTEQKILSDRLNMVEQKSGAMPDGIQTKSSSLGALVAAEFTKNEESFKRHKTLSLEIETKSIGSSLVGARGSISPTQGSDVAVVTQLLPKLKMAGSGGVASLIYGRRSVAITGPGASAVGENVSRTMSQPIFTSITQNLCTVAGYAELSETALRTTGELQSVIDLHLQADIFRASDVLLIAGGTNFAGGLLTLATTDVLPFAGTNDLLEEHIAIEAMRMRAAGYQPSIVVVNPTDWQSVYLRRETGGAYVHNSPMANAPLVIAGCEVVFSTGITTKTAMLLDSRYVDFMPHSNMRIELAYVASQFLTGEITVRAEFQGVPVVRDLAAIKLVSRAAS
jgi:HK97 family phage major capsid protein